MDETNLEYHQFISATSVEVRNPHLNKELLLIEQLVRCHCFTDYRVWVNGSSPIADSEMKDVYCPNCGAPARDCYSISGHSAGYFNATMVRNITKYQGYAEST